MATSRPEGIGSLDRTVLVDRLRALAQQSPESGLVDDLELQHLVRVILHGALLLQDLYTTEPVGSLITADPRAAARSLVAHLLADAEKPDVDVLTRAGRLPDEARRLGDKCLFDVGITGMRAFKGLDLEDLGARAYRMASEILGVLSDDRSLRAFFERNKLSPLPIEEEVNFLRQCADRFGLHADLLQRLPFVGPRPADTVTALLIPQRLSGDVALPSTSANLARLSAAIPEAPAASAFDAAHLSKDDLLSTYERIVLFSLLDVDELRSRLKETVVDQPGAVDALCDEFALYATGTHDLTKPPSYFFVGPTGVGKNHLVETLVRLMGASWGLEVPLLTIDGPNYTDASDINELRGSTRGFIRSDEEGLLAQFHERSSRTPLSVILVDEVEKSHPHLRKFFLGLMDRGTVTDNRGRTLGFSNSILVYTSNLGFSEAVARGTPIGYRGDESREAFERSEAGAKLRTALSAEFMNRVRIIRFQPLSEASIEKIFDLEFDKVRARFAEVHGVDLVSSRRARGEMIRRGYSRDFGARHLAALINRVANVEVSKRLKRDDSGEPQAARQVLDYLRDVRTEKRAFDPREMRARVLGAARVHVPYRVLTIDFDGTEFVYRT